MFRIPEYTRERNFFASWVPVSISFFAKYVMVSFYIIRRNVRVRRPQSIQSAGFPSSRPNWGPYPLTRKENLFSPIWVQGERLTRFRGRGWGPNSDEGTDSLELYVYNNPSTMAAYTAILLAKVCR